MDKDLDKKFAAIAEAMVESWKSIEVDEEDMDFNEDEDYVFNHLFEAREHLYDILLNIDRLDLREKFREEMFPEDQIKQITRLLNILLTKSDN
jgi:hypothetical protein